MLGLETRRKRLPRLPLGFHAALIALLALGSGCDPVERGEPPNVLLIVVDTLRADHLGAYGYPLETSPNIDRFAAESLQFDYALSPAPWTSPAMASLFTSTYPSAHGVTRHVRANQMPEDALSPDFTTLAEALSQAGYRTAGVTANAWVSASRGYGQGFDRFETVDYAPAPEVNALAFAAIESLRDAPPFFLYLHYMDLHPPLDPPAELLHRFEAELANHPPAHVSIERMARYDGEIAFFDQSLAALFAHLRELGLYQDMVIALVSDHGFPHMEHGTGRHGFKLHNEDIHVPLLLKVPGRTGEVDDTVSTIDLLPTLLDVAGVEPPAGIQGVSLLDAGQLAQRRELGVFSENTVRNNHRSFSRDGLKLILELDKAAHEEVSEADERGVVGLYRSREDYDERDRVLDGAAYSLLHGLLWQTYQESLEIQRSITPAQTELDDATIEELRRLGYVE